MRWIEGGGGLGEQRRQADRKDVLVLIERDGQQGVPLRVHIHDENAAGGTVFIFKAQRQTSGQVDGSGRFADPALFVRNCDGNGHKFSF